MAYSEQTLATLARPSSFDPFGAYQEGQDRRQTLADRAIAQQEQSRQTKSRFLTGQALTGNKDALNSLASTDPDAYLKVKGEGRADHERKLGEITGVLGRADTPEKWARGVQLLKARGHEFDPGEEDFANRDAILGQALSYKEQLAQSNNDRNFNADENYRSQNLDIERQKLAAPKASNRVVTDIDGKRGILDKDTGEFRPIGKSPVRGRPGLTATELKFQRESEGDQLNLGQTITSLEQALQLAPNVYEGVGAEALTTFGAKVPGAGMFGVDTEKANRSAQYSSIMSPEAIKTMADTLKGATTDFELRKFESILSDPSQPNNIKQQVITRMLTLAKQKHQLETRRLQDFERGDQTPTAPEQHGVAEPGEIPSDAISELLADPSGAAEFDAVFGEGAAAQILEAQ